MMMINENKLRNKKCTRDRESIKLGCECTHRLGDTLNSNPNLHDLTHNYTTTMRMVRIVPALHYADADQMKN